MPLINNEERPEALYSASYCSQYGVCQLYVYAIRSFLVSRYFLKGGKGRKKALVIHFPKLSLDKTSSHNYRHLQTMALVNRCETIARDRSSFVEDTTSLRGKTSIISLLDAVQVSSCLADEHLFARLFFVQLSSYLVYSTLLSRSKDIAIVNNRWNVP